MFETMRKAMFIGMGAAAMSWDKIKEAVDDLVERGDLTSEEGKKLYNEMIGRAEEQGKETHDKVKAEVRQILVDMGVADRAQITVLENRVESLERRLLELETNIPKAETTEA